ncbi:MAG: GntR family transcriptional regulator [Synergistales bacterium]
MKDPELYSTSAEAVYRKLLHMIFSRQLKPGQRLPEILIAEQLEVSRTPVREALRRLANEGLVVLIPNVGARIAMPTRQEMLDTYEVRNVLECLAIRRASERITAVQLARLEEKIEEETEVFSLRDLEAYIEINNAFHRIIAEASGNLALADTIENYLARTFVYMVFFESFFDFDTNPSLEEHRAILEALRARDAESAVRLMDRHILQATEDLSRRNLEPPDTDN